MAGGGVLQVTILVIVVLLTITRGNGLFQHTGRNLIPCNKTPRHLEKEEGFVRRKGP